MGWGARVVACLLAVGATGIEAQDVSGTWEVTWAQAVRIQADGTPQIQRWGKARLTLHQEGEALEGTWRPDVADATWKVVGTVVSGVVHLRATEHDSRNPELATVRSLNWEGILRDGRLEGRMWLVGPRAGRDPIRRPWHGERRGGA